MTHTSANIWLQANCSYGTGVWVLEKSSLLLFEAQF